MAGWFPDRYYSEYYSEWWSLYGSAVSETATWTDPVRRLSAALEVKWDGTNWTDESANLLNADGTQKIQPVWHVGSDFPPWEASFKMCSTSDRYSPTNSSSPIYSYIRYNKGHGIAIRFSVGIWTGSSFSYERVFTGYIDSISIDSTKTDQATFSCVDNALPLLQRKVTTTMYLNQYADDWLDVLADEASVEFTSFDEGMLPVPFCWVDDENTWTEMNKVTASDGGLMFFDRNGTLTFENIEAWAADTRHNTSQHSFTVSRASDYALTFDWQDCYNESIVEYAPRIQKGRVVLYELDEVVTILPGDSRTVTARLKYPAASIDTPVENKDYFVVTASGTDLSSDVDVTLTKYAQRVDIGLTNNNSYHVAYLNEFRLTGRPIIGYQALQEKLQAADSDIGNPTSGLAKTIRVSGNEYIQTLMNARVLVAVVRDRVKKARNVYAARDVPCIPTLQPGDRVTAIEAGSGLNNEAFLTAIGWKYGGGAFKADYEMIDSTSWYLYSNYFELNIHTLGSAYRVFY